jgi:hypothetical protein
LIHYLGENGQLAKSISVNSPHDTMVANNGIVYVSSIVSDQIFTISAKIFAGGSTDGFSNGNRLTATFKGPRGY